MRGFVIAASLVLVLSAAPTFAQTPPAQAKPAQQPPAQTMPPPAPQPPAPFPQGAKIGFVNFQRVIQESSDGKASTAKVNALMAKKQNEGTEKQKQLAANQQKLQTSGSVMNEAARSQLEKEIERQTKDAERFQQDAQAEINELQQEVQNEFVKKLSPIIEQIAVEKGLQIVFNLAEAGVAWATPGLDLTGDVVKRLDAVAKPAAAPKP